MLLLQDESLFVIHPGVSPLQPGAGLLQRLDLRAQVLTMLDMI